MHDLRWIRENPEEFDHGLARRGLQPRAAEVLALDREWRALQTQSEESQATLNRLNREIGGLMASVRAARPEPSIDIVYAPVPDSRTPEQYEAKIAELQQRISAEKNNQPAAAVRTAELRKQLDELLASLPNLPAPEVPDGPDETANQEMRRHGSG